MTDNLKKQPKRGILKQSTSFEQRELEPPNKLKNPHFDEQNILETFHPADKDYGFMKIDEPKTPFEYASGGEDGGDEEGAVCGGGGGGEASGGLDAQELADRIASEASRPRRLSEPSADEEDLKLLSPEEREHRRKFEQKRKKHYNEFQAVKLARQLMQEEGDDVEDEERDKEAAAAPAKKEEEKMEVEGSAVAAAAAASSS